MITGQQSTLNFVTKVYMSKGEFLTKKKRQGVMEEVRLRQGDVVVEETEKPLVTFVNHWYRDQEDHRFFIVSSVFGGGVDPEDTKSRVRVVQEGRYSCRDEIGLDVPVDVTLHRTGLGHGEDDPRMVTERRLNVSDKRPFTVYKTKS